MDIRRAIQRRIRPESPNASVVADVSEERRAGQTPPKRVEDCTLASFSNGYGPISESNRATTSGEREKAKAPAAESGANTQFVILTPLTSESRWIAKSAAPITMLYVGRSSLSDQLVRRRPPPRSSTPRSAPLATTSSPEGASTTKSTVALSEG